MSKGTVLIVNDSELTNKLVISGLRHEGYSVTVARSASEALELLMQCPFQAAILSDSLPGMGGRALLEVVRSLSSTKHLPIVFLESEESDKISAKWGVCSVSSNNLGLESLILAIKSVLNTERPSDTYSVGLLSVNKAGTTSLTKMLTAWDYDVTAITKLADLVTFPEHLTGVVIDYRPKETRIHTLLREFLDRPRQRPLPCLVVADEIDIIEALECFKSVAHLTFTPRPIIPALLKKQLGALLKSLALAEQTKCLETVMATLSKELDVSRTTTTEQIQGIGNGQYKLSLLPKIGQKLREPAAEVVSFAKAALSRVPADADIKLSLESILESGKQLVQITESVFQLFDMERDTLDVHLQKSSPIAIVWKLEDAFSRWIHSSPPRLSVTINGNLPAEIETDPERVFQNISHIVQNGIKFSVALVNLTVSSDADRNMLVFRVQDKGHGISADQLPRLFELPWDSNDQITPQTSLGTGLPFVKYVTEKLKGSLKVSTSASSGTTIELHFPMGRKRSNLLENNALFSHAEEIPNESEAVIPETIKGTVLIAEDSDNQQKLYDLFLKGTKVIYKFASTAERLYEMVTEQCWDVVIVDLELPELSTIQLSEVLKAKDDPIPIIGIASGLDRDCTKKKKDPLCNAVLLRPFEPVKLYELLSFYQTPDLGAEIRKAREQQTGRVLDALQALPDFVLPEVSAEAPELASMMEEYVASLPRILSQTEVALAEENWPVVVQATRQIAGDAGLFGYPVLASIARALMKAAAGKPEVAKVEELFAAMKEIYHRMSAGSQRTTEKEVVVEARSSAPEELQLSVAEFSEMQQKHALEYLKTFDPEFGRVTEAYAKGDLRRVAFVSNELAGAASLCGMKVLCTSLLAIEQACYARDDTTLNREFAYVNSTVTNSKKLLQLQSAPVTRESKPQTVTPVPAAVSTATCIVSEIAEGSPILIPLIKEFLCDLGGYVGRVTDAAQNFDWDELVNVSHEVAGAAGMYGYPTCRLVAKDLQTAAKDKAKDRVPTLIARLKEIATAMENGKSRL